MTSWIAVTGATSGIGLHLSMRLLERGYGVFVIGRDKVKYQNTLWAWAIANNLDGALKWCHADFQLPDNISQLNYSEFPDITGFVNCAGLLSIAPLKLESCESIHKIFNVNLLSPIELVRNLIVNKRIKKGASLVFVTSINGSKIGSKGHTLYSASKAGVTGFMMSLANELSSLRVRVNSIAPGTFTGGMMNQTQLLMSTSDFNDYAQKYPLGVGEPASVIPLIEFLLDSKSAWITGQNFIIDGGFTLN